MGQNCFKPTKFLQNKNANYKCEDNCKVSILRNNNSENLSEQMCLLSIENHNFQEKLNKILTHVSKLYLETYPDDKLQPRTNLKRMIQNNTDELPSKITRFDELYFFTDIYSLEELTVYLDNCSKCSLSSPDEDVYENNENVNNRINNEYDEINLGNLKFIDSLTKKELKYWMKTKKLHLELSKNEAHLEKLIHLLNNACRNHFIKVLDKITDGQNVALSIALLNNNIKAFCYLLKTYQAKIPLRIWDKDKMFPFLIYIAKNGKIREKKQGESVDYVLYIVLEHLFSTYPDEYIMEHMYQIDEDTRMNLPHFLLYIYNEAHDIKKRIMQCFLLCVEKCPECVNISCVSYKAPRYLFDVVANCFTQPNVDVAMCEKLISYLKYPLQTRDKEILKELIKAHHDRLKQEGLLTIIN